MVCPACGTANEPGRKFCGECGTPLAAACPTCGAMNGPGVKFCGECGTDLRVARLTARRPARRPLTPRSPNVASCRSCSPTSSASRACRRPATPRRSATCRSATSRPRRQIIEAYGGTIEKFIGDAVMAVWGAPTAFEDDAERAVRSGARPGRGRRGARQRDRRRAQVACRRPDRRGGGHARRHEPGDGRRRPRQHRLAAAIGRATRHRPRRRGHVPGRHGRHRLRARRRAAAQGQDRAGPGLPGAPGRRPARRRGTERAARGAVRRSRTGAPDAQGLPPRDRRPSGDPGWSRSSARAGSARAG